MKKIFIIIIALMCVSSLTISQTPTRQQRPKMPIEYFAEYDLSDAKTFGVSHANDEGKLFPEAEIRLSGKSRRVWPDGYHIPSPEEWAGVIPRNDVVVEEFDSPQAPVKFRKTSNEYHLDSYSRQNQDYPTFYNIKETVQIGKNNTPKTYLSDYHRPFTGNFVVYGLRFKKDDKSSFDNSQLAAFRYQLLGTVLRSTPGIIKENPNSYVCGPAFRLQVRVRYLGESFTGELKDIANEEYWNSDNEGDVIRVFSAGGVFNKIAEKDRPYLMNQLGSYWSSSFDFFSFGIVAASVCNNGANGDRLVRCVADK